MGALTSGGGLHPAGEVGAARMLKNPQLELRQDRQEVIEDVRLDRLVVCPHLVAAEDVDLESEPVRTGRKLANQEGHVPVDLGMCAQVGFNVGAECAEVGQPAPVGRHGRVGPRRLVVGFNLCPSRCEVIAE